jgi:hypothetical protein
MSRCRPRINLGSRGHALFRVLAVARRPSRPVYPGRDVVSYAVQVTKRKVELRSPGPLQDPVRYWGEARCVNAQPMRASDV